MKNHPHETLQEGLPKQSCRDQKRSVVHEPSNVAWVLKRINMDKISERPVYANSNSSSCESEHDILGFHSSLFGNVEDVHVSNQEISHASFLGKDRSSSNIVRDSVPRTIDGNISLIDIDQVNIIRL